MSVGESRIFDRLAAPFPPSAIHWRIGRKSKSGGSTALVLPYINARDVMDRFDQVVGPESWQNRYPHAGDKVICEISIRHKGEWITKSDGAGDTSVEADKGAISDALKRTAVLWGVARYLYRMDSIWVNVDGNKIHDAEMPKLQSALKEAAWTTNPVSGERIDSTGALLMDRQDVVELYDKCTIRIEELELESFDPIVVVRDCLSDYPEYKGLRTEQFNILPKNVGAMLSKRISEWKPIPVSAEDF